MTTPKCEGEILTRHEQIGTAVDDYYNALLGHAPEQQYTIDLDALDIPMRDLNHLDAPFSAEEVEKVVKAMPQDKAAGPDGFTGRFFTTCWHIIKDDFLRALEAFYRGDMRGLPAIDKAIVSLLPKKDGAIELRDFLPVSLVHGAIKIFDKILTTRLVDELPKLVGIHQSAFVKGRSLHDTSCLSNALLDGYTH